MAPPEDFADFCAREHPRLVGALDLYCGDLGVAEELAAEALVRACERWEEVRAMAAPGAWVHRVAMNLTNSWYRRRRAERRALARIGPVGVHLEENTAEVMAVREALVLLPRRQRQAVILRHYLGVPAAEVAQLMGITPGNARVLVHRGLAAMRDLLGDAVVEVSDGT